MLDQNVYIYLPTCVHTKQHMTYTKHSMNMCKGEWRKDGKKERRKGGREDREMRGRKEILKKIMTQRKNPLIVVDD